MLGRVVRLTAAERHLAVEGACLSIVAAVAVRVFAPGRVARRFARLSRAASIPLDVPPARAAALVAAAASFVPGSTCLTRALALSAVLARRGVPSRVVIGARRAASGLEAHAWVTCDGRVILGEATRESYAEIARLGAASPEAAA